MLDWLFGHKKAAAERIRNKKKEDVPGPATQADLVHTTAPSEQEHAGSSEPPAPTAFTPQEPVIVPEVTAPGATPEIESLPQAAALVHATVLSEQEHAGSSEPPEPTALPPQEPVIVPEVTAPSATPEIESIPQATAQPPKPLATGNNSDCPPQTSPEYSEVALLDTAAPPPYNDQISVVDETITELKSENSSFLLPVVMRIADEAPAVPAYSTFGGKYSPPKVDPVLPSPATEIESGISSTPHTPMADNEIKTLEKADDQSIAVTYPCYDRATIVRVQADGRRIIVRTGNMTRAYSCRKDGTYRLDGAPDQSPEQLLLDETMAGFKSANISFKPLPVALPRLNKGRASVKMSKLASSTPLQRGEVAIAAAPPRYDEVQILSIQAGGRRVIVSFGTAMRAYSRRKDSSYRLEGAPNSSTSSQLVINATLDEVVLLYRNKSLTRYKPKSAEA